MFFPQQLTLRIRILLQSPHGVAASMDDGQAEGLRMDLFDSIAVDLGARRGPVRFRPAWHRSVRFWWPGVIPARVDRIAIIAPGFFHALHWVNLDPTQTSFNTFNTVFGNSGRLKKNRKTATWTCFPDVRILASPLSRRANPHLHDHTMCVPCVEDFFVFFAVPEGRSTALGALEWAEIFRTSVAWLSSIR